MLTASAMGYFEDEIAKAVVLALFVPLIISSGGNSGSQASTLIIQAMAVGEITLTDWWRVLRREMISGLLLGAGAWPDRIFQGNLFGIQYFTPMATIPLSDRGDSWFFA